MTANPRIISGPCPLVWHRVLFNNSNYPRYLNVAIWADQQPQNPPTASLTIVHEDSNVNIKTPLPIINSDSADNGGFGLGERHLHYLLGLHWGNIEQVNEVREKAGPPVDPSSSDSPHPKTSNSESISLETIAVDCRDFFHCTTFSLTNGRQIRMCFDTFNSANRRQLRICFSSPDITEPSYIPQTMGASSEVVDLTKTSTEDLDAFSPPLSLEPDAISELTFPKTNVEIVETPYIPLSQPKDPTPKHTSFEKAIIENSLLPPQPMDATSDRASLEVGIEKTSSTISPQQTNIKNPSFDTSADANSSGAGPKSRFGITLHQK